MRKLKILVVYANHGGCSYYRQLSPMKMMQEMLPDKVEVRYTDNPLEVEPENNYAPPKEKLKDMNWADIVFVANILKYGGPYTARVVGLAKEMGKFVHFDTDDLLTGLYEEHHLYETYKTQKLDDITKFCYYNSDLVTVTQLKFARRIQPYINKCMAVIKNVIDYSLPAWNHPKSKAKFTRIGYAAGIHHRGDVKVFNAIPHLVNQKVGRENVQWNFYGHPPPDPSKKGTWEAQVWPEYMSHLLRGFKGGKNYNIHYALPPDAYGKYYADMDVAIAPLEMNEFNDSKSDIKVAECSRYKIPLVASNVGCYEDTIINGETGYLIEPGAPRSEWVRVLSKLCKDKKHRIELGLNLHDKTKDLFDGRKQTLARFNLYEAAIRDTGHKLDD
jgi:glycosyltransferase involved in cell wall biosynthesis